MYLRKPYMWVWMRSLFSSKAGFCSVPQFSSCLNLQLSNKSIDLRAMCNLHMLNCRWRYNRKRVELQESITPVLKTSNKSWMWGRRELHQAFWTAITSPRTVDFVSSIKLFRKFFTGSIGFSKYMRKNNQGPDSSNKLSDIKVKIRGAVMQKQNIRK